MAQKQEKLAVVGLFGILPVLSLFGLVLAQKAKTTITKVTTLTIVASPPDGVAPLTVVFSGKATDVYGKSVAGATLYFFINNVSIPGSVITAQDGTYAFQYTLSQAGTYDCTIAASPNVFATAQVST